MPALPRTLDPDLVHRRRWWTLGVLCLSLVIVIVGNTVLNITLPTLVRELGASNSELQWMVDAYALVFAGLLLTNGAIGDRFGRKRALNTGLVVFGVTSTVAAFSSDAGQVIAARAVMGLGASLVMPATLSILTTVFPPQERARAIAIWAGLSGGGAALGPIAAGWLLGHFWWGSVFLLNAPLVVLALVAGVYLVPDSRDPHQTPLDPVGAGLSILGLGVLVYGIIEAPVHGWASGRSLLAFAVAAVLVAMFAAWELRTEHPMLDLRFFRRPGFSSGAGAITLVFFAMFGLFFLGTQYFQMVLGYSPLGTGVRLLPVGLTIMAAAPNSARLAERIGTKGVVRLGLTLVAVGLVGWGTAGPDASYLRVIVPLALAAGGMGLTVAPSTASIMASLPLAKAGVGSATNDTTRELGGALGVAVLGSLAASQYASSLAPALRALPPPLRDAAQSSLGGALGVAARVGGAGGDRLAEAARVAFTDGIRTATIVGAATVAVAAVVVGRYMPARVDPHGEGRDVAADVAAATGVSASVKGEALEP